ncbi:hypothetical protein QE152_g40117 [Popillia japonica]|uniref:Uncharacterized protein n=1 Tax=Popillia japonica TaxID=7064 RepID=A0AAW1HSA8_POPJA
MRSRGQKILEIALTQAKCNEIFEKPVITSDAIVADNMQDSIIEDAEIVMEIYPTNNFTHGIPHENLEILATGCGNATGNVISLNNDVHNTIFVSQNIGPFSNTKEILGDNTDESQLPESPPKHFIEGSGNEDNEFKETSETIQTSLSYQKAHQSILLKAVEMKITNSRKLLKLIIEGSGNEDNEFKETFKINILQNIIIKNNGNGSHYQADEVDTNNLQHEEESEVPPYLREESSDTTELEQEQEEKSVEIRETRGKKRKRNAGNWKKNIRKQRKAAGEEYLSATNKLFSKNEMKAPCRDECKKQCKQNISVESRALIHSQFWNSSIELDQKRQFISSCKLH